MIITDSAVSSRVSRAARLMWTFAGVDQAVLARAPQDRPRFTALGVMLAAGSLVTGIALFVAIRTVFEYVPTAVALLIAAAVTAFLLAIDRWVLWATPLTGRKLWRFTTLVPILMIDLVLGLILGNVIAIRVFDRPIHDNALVQRRIELGSYEARLWTCNPAPGAGAAVAPTPGCADFTVRPPSQIADELQSRRAALAKVHNAQVSAVESMKVADLEKSLVAAQQDYTGYVAREIDSRVRVFGNNQGAIGALEINEAFERLRSRNDFVDTVVWVFVILLLGFRLAPLLSRLAAGPTAYDKLTGQEYQRIAAMRQIRARIVERVARWDET